MMLYVFTEEPSMKEALKVILPKLGVAPGAFKVIAFQGVGNLENGLENQLRALDDPNSRFLILRDNDRGDCKSRKARLLGMVSRAGRSERTKVRIVCEMLEAWFIADTNALNRSGLLSRDVPVRLARCNPDMLDDPKKALSRLRAGYNEISGAKAIAPHLDLTNTRSASFKHTIQAIKDLMAA